jgi:hypothetical protein
VPMPSLRTALATVHRDRLWWRKVLVGGGLWLTVVGAPAVEGHSMESLDNTLNGYPTPLPRWNDLITKWVQGMFALVIDFTYFVLPLLAAGLLLLCSAIAVSVSGTGTQTLQILGPLIGGALVVWLGAVWLSSVSPIGKRLYAGEGQPNTALSLQPLRDAWDPAARGLFLSARLQSLPAFGLALVLFGLAWQAATISGWLALVGFWLGSAALHYARLVSIQLYDAAAREVQRRKFEAFRARVRS